MDGEDPFSVRGGEPSMNTPVRTRVRGFRMVSAILVALALLAAACGSDASVPTVDTSAVDDANAAAAAAQERADELAAQLEEAQAAAEAAGSDDGAAEALAEAEAAAEEARAAAADAEERAAAAEQAAADASAMSDEPSRSITVALVGNDNIVRMGELAAEYFTPETGIEVNLTVLDEQTLREVTTRDVGAGGEQFDVVQIGMYETP